LRVLISALEPSSNLHLKELLKYMECEICGIYDKNLSSFPPLYDMREFSVMGFVDIFSKIFKSLEAMSELVFLSKECDVALLIDAPAFNLRLAKKLKKSNPNIKIIYYILPKVWAWKRGRVKQIEKYCDEAISIFPFEDRFYNNSKYLGNPLLDEIDNLKNEITKSDIVSFLAGSRKSEIRALMPIFRDMAREFPDKRKLLVVPKHFDSLDIYGDISGFEVVYDTQRALYQSEYAFICSGTATLESAIIGTPFTLVYIAKKIDYTIANIFVKLNFVGLANIIFEFDTKEKFHDELLQDDVTLENLISSYKNRDENKFLENSKTLRAILQNGSSEKLAKLININF
jgi:lipid-A-disaccharide synthase